MSREGWRTRPSELPGRGVRRGGRRPRRVPGLVAAPPARADTKERRALIAGAGPAGDAVAAGLRDAGFEGRITLVGAEGFAPYERPHLSKGYLLGTVPGDRLALRPSSQYRDLGVDLVLGDRVVELDASVRRARLGSGVSIDWDVACIATGSTARRLPGLERALYLRELPDAERLRRMLDAGGALAIVGAGFIGCEVAAAAVEKGCRVRMFEAQEQPLLGVLGEELGGYLAAVHGEHGVDLRLDARSLPELDGPVVAGVGSLPRTELAEASGLEVDRGVVVDALGRTSAPGVYAAGDVARFFSPWAGSHIRVEHFQTAQRQGFAAGRAMAGAEDPYDEVPWFWSDQYDLNLQYAGAGLLWDHTVERGRLGRPPFTVFYLAGRRLVAAAGVNDHHTVARARRLMQRRHALTDEQLADPGFDLRLPAPG